MPRTTHDASLTISGESSVEPARNISVWTGSFYFKEIVDHVDWNGINFDLSATAEGNFDDEKSQLVLRLDCFATPENSSNEEKLVLPLALPSPQIVRETMSRDEAVEAAKEIFESWARCIRKSVPAATGLTNYAGKASSPN